MFVRRFPGLSWRGFIFYGERNAFALVEDAPRDVQSDEQQGGTCDAENNVEMLVDGDRCGVNEGGAKPDGREGESEKLNEFAQERGEREGKGAHFKNARGELKDLQRRRRGEHRRDENSEEFLALEAVSDALIALPIDPFEEEEFASCAADVKGDEGAKGGSGCSRKAVEKEHLVVVLNVANDDAVHRHGKRYEGGIRQGEEEDAPHAKG